MSVIPLGDRSAIGTPPDLISYPTLILAVLRFLFEGWQIALASEQPPIPSEEEEAMNGMLAQGIRAFVRAEGFSNIDIVETPGERTDPTLRLPDVEPDVILILAHFDGGVMLFRAIVECKRLDPLQAPRRTLRRDYCTRGMDRFIAERYGREHQLCFMAGYVLRQDGAAAMADVNTYLDAVGRGADLLVTAPQYGHLGYVGASSHPRPAAPPINLLHAFLPFTATPDAATSVEV